MYPQFTQHAGQVQFPQQSGQAQYPPHFPHTQYSQFPPFGQSMSPGQPQPQFQASAPQVSQQGAQVFLKDLLMLLFIYMIIKILII